LWNPSNNKWKHIAPEDLKCLLLAHGPDN
jgi:hypothetical protein